MSKLKEVWRKVAGNPAGGFICFILCLYAVFLCIPMVLFMVKMFLDYVTSFTNWWWNYWLFGLTF